MSTPFWDLFEMPFAEAERPWEACQDVASRGGEFVIHGVRVAGKYERGSFTMRFRCAGRVLCLVDAPCHMQTQQRSAEGCVLLLTSTKCHPPSCLAVVALRVSAAKGALHTIEVALHTRRGLSCQVCMPALCGVLMQRSSARKRAHRGACLLRARTPPLTRRPAGKDVLDENTPLVGVPAVAKHNPAASQRFYFALVSAELAGPVGSASMSLSFPGTPSQVLRLP